MGKGIISIPSSRILDVVSGITGLKVRDIYWNPERDTLDIRVEHEDIPKVPEGEAYPRLMTLIDDKGRFTRVLCGDKVIAEAEQYLPSAEEIREHIELKLSHWQRRLYYCKRDEPEDVDHITRLEVLIWNYEELRKFLGL